MSGRKVAAVLLCTAALSLAALGSASAADDALSEDQIDVEAVPIREGGLAEPFSGLQEAGDEVRVEIVHEPSRDEDLRAAVDRLDGEVLGASPGVLLVRIPAAAVPGLDRRPDVVQVRAPLRVDLVPGPVAPTEAPLAAGDVHVTATNAQAWHDAGHRGAGIKVGIVDYFDGATWNAAQASGDVPAPAGTFCRAAGIGCNIWSSGSRHGVAVGEIINDMAPEASLYLATAVTATDLAAVVAWFDDQGVQIISRSLGSQFDGPGDGTGSIDAIVDDAVSRGMIWLNAAGNHASASGTGDGGYWRGSFIDADANDWLEFGPGDETLGFVCGFIQGFRWSDWEEGGRSDYDVYIVDAFGNLLASSFQDQTTGAPPIELIDPAALDCNANPVVFMVVHLWDAGSGTAGDVLEFMVNNTSFEYSSNPYSSSGPASDSANAGMLTIGAVDPPAGSTIATYSSQGPTNDLRIKPDLSAPSCLPNVSYTPSCFNGTSGATPVVAGAAALVWGAGEATAPRNFAAEETTTPQTIAQYLRTSVVDRGIVGADNVYGTGQLVLGDPPGPANMPPEVSAGPDMAVAIGQTATLDGTVSDDGLPSGTLTTTWSRHSGSLGTVTFADANAVDTTVTFGALGVYVLRLTASDGALSAYDDVSINVTAAPPPADSFHDDDDSVFESDIEWMAAVGITNGCNPPHNDRFCPDSDVTRGQMAAFLARALELSDAPGDPFVDDDGSLFEDDIEKLAAAGVTKGCNPPVNDRFCPDDKVTRGQMAAFMVRAMGYVDDGGGNVFIDDDGSIFEADIDKLATAGVTKGCNPPVNDRFCPTGYVTRGQMAAFLHRAFG